MFTDRIGRVPGGRCQRCTVCTGRATRASRGRPSPGHRRPLVHRRPIAPVPGRVRRRGTPGGCPPSRGGRPSGGCPPSRTVRPSGGCPPGRARSHRRPLLTLIVPRSSHSAVRQFPSTHRRFRMLLFISKTDRKHCFRFSAQVIYNNKNYELFSLSRYSIDILLIRFYCDYLCVRYPNVM